MKNRIQVILIFMVGILLAGSTTPMESDKTNPNLKLKLNEVASFTTEWDTKNLEVSEASVAWHMDHIYLMVNQLHKALKYSDESNYKAESNKVRDYVFASNTLPRGQVTAPESVSPKGTITMNTLQKHYDEALATVQKLPMLAEKKHFNHPILGTMNRDETIKFLIIHTEHHLKIIRDILKNKENIKITMDKFEVVENDKTQRLDSLYTELYKYGEFNGNILVAKDGKEIYAKSFGISDSDKNIALQRNSIFYLASVSKQFTAFSIFLLQKQGELSLDDAISKYLPQLDYYNDIKIKHLVYHTSGVADYLDLFNDEKYDSLSITNDALINLLAETKPKLKFDPGEKFEYSNTGYILLASIVESITNQKFGIFLDEQIFEPLEMNNTRHLMYDDTDTNWKKNQIAKAYYQSTEEEELMQTCKGVYGHSKVYSTVVDLLKWDKALKENTLISQEETDFIFSPGVLNSDEKTRYGFGLFLKDKEPYGKFIYHSGYFPGYLTYLSRHIETGYTIIVLQNNDNRTGKRRLAAKETRNIIYNLPIEKDIRIPSTILQKYVGNYISEEGSNKKIKLLHQTLWADDSELIPINKTKFRVNGFWPEVTYTFNVNEDGSVKSYRVQQKEHDLDKTYFLKK